jgi:Uncharacterized protein conserved in bacteria (DUF2066)
MLFYTLTWVPVGRALSGIPPQRPMRFIHHLATVVCVLCPLLVPVAARAVVVDGLYDAIVVGESTDTARKAAASEALRRVAVRLTGRRTAANDDALAALYADPERFVRSYRSVAAGQVAVSFDGKSLTAALEAARQAVWSPDRPSTLVVTVAVADPHDLGALPTKDVRDLQMVAQDRGVPLQWPGPVPTAETAGLLSELSTGGTGRLWALAQSAGASGVLLGRVGPLGVDWSRVGPEGAVRLPGGAADAVDGLVAHYLSRRTVDVGVVGTISLTIEGIVDLTALVGLERSITAIPGIRSAGIENVNGTVVRVRVQTGLDARDVRRALVATGHISADESGESKHLVYQP